MWHPSPNKVYGQGCLHMNTLNRGYTNISVLKTWSIGSALQLFSAVSGNCIIVSLYCCSTIVNYRHRQIHVLQWYDVYGFLMGKIIGTVADIFPWMPLSQRASTYQNLDGIRGDLASRFQWIQCHCSCSSEFSNVAKQLLPCAPHSQIPEVRFWQPDIFGGSIIRPGVEGTDEDDSIHSSHQIYLVVFYLRSEPTVPFICVLQCG